MLCEPQRVPPRKCVSRSRVIAGMILLISVCSSRTNRESGAPPNGGCPCRSTPSLSCARLSSKLKRCLTRCHRPAKALADRAPRRLPNSVPGCTPRCAPLLSAPYFSLDTFGGKLLETENSRCALSCRWMRGLLRREEPHAEHTPSEDQTGSSHSGRHQTIRSVA
jgi:hypothetical protein